MDERHCEWKPVYFIKQCEFKTLCPGEWGTTYLVGGWIWCICYFCVCFGWFPGEDLGFKGEGIPQKIAGINTVHWARGYSYLVGSDETLMYLSWREYTVGTMLGIIMLVCMWNLTCKHSETEFDVFRARLGLHRDPVLLLTTSTVLSTLETSDVVLEARGGCDEKQNPDEEKLEYFIHHRQSELMSNLKQSSMFCKVQGEWVRSSRMQTVYLCSRYILIFGTKFDSWEPIMKSSLNWARNTIRRDIDIEWSSLTVWFNKHGGDSIFKISTSFKVVNLHIESTSVDMYIIITSKLTNPPSKNFVYFLGISFPFPVWCSQQREELKRREDYQNQTKIISDQFIQL